MRIIFVIQAWLDELVLREVYYIELGNELCPPLIGEFLGKYFRCFSPSLFISGYTSYLLLFTEAYALLKIVHIRYVYYFSKRAEMICSCCYYVLRDQIAHKILDGTHQNLWLNENRGPMIFILETLQSKLSIRML